MLIFRKDDVRVCVFIFLESERELGWIWDMDHILDRGGGLWAHKNGRAQPKTSSLNHDASLPREVANTRCTV
jgi:hypothetical protein